MNSEEKILKMIGKKSALTEDAVDYIAKKLNQPKNIIKEFMDAETEFTAACLIKDGKVRLLGRATLIKKDKGDGNYHITAKAPIRLYNKVDELLKNNNIQLEEEKIDTIVQQVTYLE